MAAETLQLVQLALHRLGEPAYLAVHPLASRCSERGQPAGAQGVDDAPHHLLDGAKWHRRVAQLAVDEAQEVVVPRRPEALV